MFVPSPAALTSRLLIGALREQDAAAEARAAAARTRHMNDVIRSLSHSIEERATRDTVRRLKLIRPGSWSLLEVVERDGLVRRLPPVHPDPRMRPTAGLLAREWASARPDADPSEGVVTRGAVALLLKALRDVESLSAMNAIGFGSLLVVPLMRDRTRIGSMTFVSPAGELPFAEHEMDLAREIAAQCAIALTNARAYSDAKRQRRAADAANLAKSSFLGTISHELRTPLNAIGGYVDLMELGLFGPVTSEQHKSFTRIKANQRHLVGLITQVIDFVRLDGGHMAYRRDLVSLDRVRNDVVMMLSGLAHEKGLDLETPPADEVAVWGDSDRVSQIVVNLVSNAIKYGAEGPGAISIRCVARDATAAIVVTDRGPGIPPDECERIFQPFVQLGTDRRGGVGLGLAISRELAIAMGGTLTVVSRVGVGSTFTLTLTRADTAR